MISTSCEDCVFATWDGTSQKGCSFNAISKLVENGAELEKIPKDDGFYYIIKGRLCNRCRNSTWGESHPRRKWKSIVKEEIKLGYDIIIYISKDTKFEDIQNSIRSVNNQLVKPNIVIFLVDYDYKDTSVNDVVSFVQETLNLPWKVEQVTEEASPLDEAVKSSTGFYYSLFHAGAEIPEDYLSRIENAVNEDMLRITALEPDENNNGMLIQKMVHDNLAGNKGDMIFNKIKQICEENNTQFMIREWKDL